MIGFIASLKIIFVSEIWFQIEVMNKLPYIRQQHCNSMLWVKANGFN